MRGRPKEFREYDLLAILREDPRMSIQEMCDATGIKAKSHVHGLLKKLEDQGLIRREPVLSRSVQIGGERRPKSEMKALHVTAKARAPKYSRANYEKKAEAGKHGRGKSALQSKAERRLSEEQRIEAVVARAKANEAEGGFDVLHDFRHSLVGGRVHATKIG